MEAIIFVGIQGAGKTTFFKERFADSHVRINLDMLRTRHRERLIFTACLGARQKIVVDNTNLTQADRRKYIFIAKEFGFKIVGCYFQTDLVKAIERNNRREGKASVPQWVISSAFDRLQTPSYAEGFDEIYDIWINDQIKFVVENRKDEV